MLPRRPELPSGSGAEAELLLCCARVHLEPRHTDRIGELLEANVAWDDVLRLARQHRLLPLLSSHLATGAFENIPADVLGTLRRSATTNAKHSLLLTGELREVVQLFAAAGISVVPYKGPVLAQQLYGTVALRDMGDLDLLVPKHHVQRAQELLIARGYRLPQALSAAQQRAVLRADCNIAFVKPGSSWITLELHWGFAGGRSALPMEFSELTSRLTSVSLAGVEFPAFAREDLLLILSFHGAKHMWERLEWICGVAELIRQGDLDWELALTRASHIGSRRVILLGAALAKRLLDAPLPSVVQAELQKDRTIDSLLNETYARLFDGDEALAHSLGWPFHRYQLRAKERLRERLRYVYYSAVAPAKEDWTAVPLPQLLFPLYFVVRPIRLVGEYGVRLSRSFQ